MEFFKSFNCDDNLSQYVDSMLFDKYTVIALAAYEDDNYKASISLEVVGNVEVSYKGKDYYAPSEFPDELKERIKNDKQWFITAPSGEGNDEEESGLYIRYNNWFEYIYTVKGKHNNVDYSDGVLCEFDLSNGTKQDVYDEMKEIVKSIINK